MFVKALRKALADYTANVSGQGGADPTIDKEKLIAHILQVIFEAKGYLQQHGFDLQALLDAKDFEKMRQVQAGAEAVSGSLENRKAFQACASELIRVMKYASHEDT